jgi:hypothetical protein
VRSVGRILGLGVVLAVLAACGSDPAPESSGPSSEQCAERRGRLVEDVRLPLQIAADGMRYDGSLPSNGLGRVEVALETALASECVEESAALNTLADLAATPPVTERDIQKADAAFEQWARSMGSNARINFPPPRPNPCPQMRREVMASYRVIREPEVGGVRISFELVLANKGSRLVYLDHGGQVRATHVRPNDRTRTYGWGGSSADTAAARAGRSSTQRIELVAPDPLRLFPDGRVEVFDVYGSAYSKVGPCPLMVSRMP